MLYITHCLTKARANKDDSTLRSICPDALAIRLVRDHHRGQSRTAVEGKIGALEELDGSADSHS
jgi:hypothetical protein